MNSRNRIFTPAILAITLALLTVGVTVSAYSSKRASSRYLVSSQNKIAPWVLAQTANGKSAEFIALLADHADLTDTTTLAAKEAKSHHVYAKLYDHAQKTQAPLRAWLRANNLPHQSFYLVNALLVTGTRAVAEAVAARPEVARIEGNPAIGNQPLAQPSAAELAQFAQRVAAPQAIEPGLSVIRAPEVWNLGFKGNGIVIGSADSGVAWNHAALLNRYRGTGIGHDYNWCDTVGGVNCDANSFQPIDDHNHGTHTIGTALGYDSGSNQIGVAPEAKFIACRCMDANLVGTPGSYLKCLEWFLAPYPIGGTPAQGDVSKRPDIVLAGWTCPPSEGCAVTTLSTAVTNLRNAGIAVVTMAGSNGPGCSTVFDPPGIYDASYTVGAVNSLNTANIVPASFSSRGPVTVDNSNRLKPDIVAPGVDVRSAQAGGGYANFSGTSMAAAHVAGAIALLWSAQPALKGNINATEDLLNAFASGMTSAACNGNVVPNNVTGFGLLNIKQAVDNALAGPKVVKDDFDGDGKTDFSFWRGAQSTWHILKSGSNNQLLTPLPFWGASYAPYYDIATPGDFDGDRKFDAVVWRSSNGYWYILNSASSYTQYTYLLHGQNGDTPVPSDYDGDGKADMAVWRGAESTWHILKSGSGNQLLTPMPFWGASYAPYYDIAVPADFDGDRKSDLAVWRSATGYWYVLTSTSSYTQHFLQQLGQTGDIPVPGNYDGDLRHDYAVWRPSNGTWYIINSSTGQSVTQQLGQSGDVPVPGDYDGDGKFDIAVWRPSNGTWYVLKSTDGQQLTLAHGQNGDTPCPAFGVR